MIRDLLQQPDPRLLEVAKEVTAETDVLDLVRDLIDTKKEFGGYALAAPQIGVGLRVIVGPADLTPRVLLNPVIVRRGKDTEKGFEGCLSIAFGKTSFEVNRSRIITVEYRDIHFEPHTFVAKGLAARILQHEMDHLDGKLIG